MEYKFTFIGGDKNLEEEIKNTTPLTIEKIYELYQIKKIKTLVKICDNIANITFSKEMD